MSAPLSCSVPGPISRRRVPPLARAKHRRACSSSSSMAAWVSASSCGGAPSDSSCMAKRANEAIDACSASASSRPCRGEPAPRVCVEPVDVRAIAVRPIAACGEVGDAGPVLHVERAAARILDLVGHVVAAHPVLLEGTFELDQLAVVVVDRRVVEVAVAQATLRRWRLLSARIGVGVGCRLRCLRRFPPSVAPGGGKHWRSMIVSVPPQSPHEVDDPSAAVSVTVAVAVAVALPSASPLVIDPCESESPLSPPSVPVIGCLGGVPPGRPGPHAIVAIPTARPAASAGQQQNRYANKQNFQHPFKPNPRKTS